MADNSNILFRKWEVAGRRRRSLWRLLSPPQLFIGSFATLVLFGTLALKLIPGLYVAEPMGWLDALFTATSAACITGLIVEDTATFFTPRGQAVVLVLIQLGGLGIIAFTSLIIVAFGRRMSLRHEAMSGGGQGVAPEVNRQNLVRDVFIFTFVTETIGAILLFLIWLPSLDRLNWTWQQAAWHAVFQSISAFCHAGFATFSDSLVGFQTSPGVLGVIMLLIVIGSIGFLTLEEIKLHWQAKKLNKRFRISLHSRIVLATTAILIVGGWILFTIFEWDYTLRRLPTWAKLTNGLFLSLTPRSAGYNTVDYSQTTASTNFLTIIFMSIGGSPGSMAGGVKTTTVALIALLAWSRLRGRLVTSIAGRSVPEETIQRAVGLFVIAFGIVTVSIFILTTTEIRGEAPPDFINYMFEAVSAFNTVGLSMGVTNELSDAGKWLTIFLMFFGRVGPLTLAAALARPRKQLATEFRYAHEEVVVG
ncbi:MAG TPA: potassium transporter TrkG [Tepidisphaeraceae bacterium]|nr:potassium transporter TrkG [Tepidisphaeraceae bacterium]